jgi:hypothetical protein
MDVAATWAVFAALFLAAASARGEEDFPPVVEFFLAPGRWIEGETKFAASPVGQQARFSLGLLRVLGAFERLSNGLYKHGLLSQYLEPLPEDVRSDWYNPDPEPIDDQKLGDLVRRFVRDLETAERTLAQVEDPNVKLRLPVGRFALQLERRARDNPLVDLSPVRPSQIPEIAEWVVVFDKADATWLRGYCHLLMGVGEGLVACDWKDWFDRCGHLFFPKVDGPYTFLEPWRLDEGSLGNPTVVAGLVGDALAAVAKAEAPVVDPKRLARSREHFLAVLAMSRKMWEEIRAETDDDLEWIPGPNQKPVIPGATVSEEMVESWLAALDEVERILNGELLVPFWRGREVRGINVKRAFLEAKRVSLVDWVQGVAAAEFLEEGPIANGEVWIRFLRAFGVNALPYAIWWN